MSANLKKRIVMVLGVLFGLDFVVLALKGSSLNFGIVLPGIISALLFFNNKIIITLKRILGNYYLLSIKILKIFLCLSLCIFIILEMFIYSAVNTNYNKNAKVAIILGAGVKKYEPSVILKSRINEGGRYLKLHKDVVVIASGGQGPGEYVSEAQTIKKYLINIGINQDRIFLEDKSTSTSENIKYSKQVLSKLKITNKKDVVIITNDFHMYRAKYIAKKLGLNPVGYCVKTPFYLIANTHIREYAALLKEYVTQK